jgi:hypothetical protein
VNGDGNYKSFILVLVYKAPGDIVFSKLPRTGLFVGALPLGHFALSPDATGLK